MVAAAAAAAAVVASPSNVPHPRPMQQRHHSTLAVAAAMTLAEPVEHDNTLPYSLNFPEEWVGLVIPSW